MTLKLFPQQQNRNRTTQHKYTYEARNKPWRALGKKDFAVYQCPSDGVYLFNVNTITEIYLILCLSSVSMEEPSTNH